LDTSANQSIRPGGARAVLYVGTEQNVGYAVGFDASQSKGTNPLGQVDSFGIESYAWDFADGTSPQSSAYLPTITHTLAMEGDHFVHVPIYYDVSYGTDITIEGQLVTPPLRGNSPSQ
jgi:hypothetical protein